MDAVEDEDKREPLFTAGKSTNESRHLQKSVQRFLRKLRQIHVMTQLCSITKGLKIPDHRNTCPLTVVIALFT